MPRVDKTMLVAVLAGAAIAAVSASCANSCSGHGSCGSHDRCTCYAMWEGTDCSKRICPSGPSFTSGGSTYEVCSGRGTCDSGSGTCTCSEGYTGYNCGRTACPNDCSGHGKCMSTGVDGGMTQACVCDGYYTGIDCSFRQCPRGDDPLTTEIECQGVSSGAQSHEVQEITITADKQLSGEMTLTYTDAYGQSWTTMPIQVGGDLEYDVRMEGSGGCSLKYMSATLSSEKFRGSGDVLDSTSGTVVGHDFAATEFGVPGVLAEAMNSDDCDGLTAAEMQRIIELNGVVKNVRVTKSGDASTGTARFHVSIGDLNFQNENDGMEIGVFSMTGRTDAVLHSLGDRSQDIKDALEALPYNVIPSVDVSRVKVDAGSDYADATVVYGNMVKQKYRITFSDAANAGDQVSLQCNANGCDADGCAPRYKGITHKRYISTKYRSDPMSTEGGVTDYRTAIVATGQGSWWLRSHSLDVRTKSPFTSGTYHVHWDLGNGKISSASFAYNADETAIQSALRTIEGWGGVSVSCHGTPGFAGRRYDGTTEEYFGMQCKVTYAKGFDDGGKLPTMTYTNIHQGMDAAETSGTATHYTNLKGINSFECKNEICKFGRVGNSGDGDYTSRALFLGAQRYRTSATNTGCTGIICDTAKQDNFIGYVYIRHDDTGSFPSEGTYEIVRVGSRLSNAVYTDLVIYAPGVPDIANRDDAFGTTSGKVARLYKATPLMPMWPSFSNSIALHDTSFRIIFQPNAPDVSATVPERLGPKYDDTSDATLAAWSDGFDDTPAVNLMYMEDGAQDSTDSANNNNIAIATTCADILTTLNGFTGNENEGGPFPSLAATDGTSICDCKRTTMEVDPFEVEVTITCPGWLGYLLNSDTAKDAATDVTNYLESSLLYSSAHLVVTDNDQHAMPYNVYTGHRRLSPERSLEQIVAVGDTITVTASGSNDNKQYKVKSFAYDNMWGDGNKGSAIWSGKEGYLGEDSSSGMAAAINLKSTIDYASYGDFVPFLKVDPAPSEDYLVTEMYTEGTNGTFFTRTLEDISTFRSEIATLKLYDAPANEGLTANTNSKFDASQLSGSFQLIYDGEESPVIPVTSSANQIMGYLSEMTALTHVPIVRKSQTSGATWLSDDYEAVDADSDTVMWKFTFDPRFGDAKKLTFKFVDAVGDERKTSNIIGSGGSALTNTVTDLTVLGIGTTPSKTARAAKNKIVMTYTSGSVFYDAIDDDFNGATRSSGVGDGNQLIDDHVSDDRFHDELAMDVVPGTKLKVSSSEVHHMYIYQVTPEGAGDAIATPSDGCTANAVDNPHVVLEYAGAFTSAVSLCSAADTWNTASAMEALIEADISALNGISISIDDTSMSDDFEDHFAWGADHNGVVRGRFSFTLPMGADGDSFKVHFQSGLSQGSGVNWYHDSAKSSLLKILTYRQRNNNGREFTVTKAYENKVSDLISLSRINSFNSVDGGALAGVIYTPSQTNAETWETAVLANDNVGCGLTVRGKMIPGIYHNVRTKLAGSKSDSDVGAGTGAILMVVVGGDKHIKEVQVTSGGAGSYLPGHKYAFADTRLHASMDIGTPAATCVFEVPDMKTSAKTSSPMKSVASGTSSADNCLSLNTATNTCASVQGAKFHNVPQDNTAITAGDPEDDVRGMRTSVECTASAVTKVTVTYGGISGLGTDTGTRDDDITASDETALHAGDGSTQLGITTECINDFYYQFGFYTTNTPRWNRDLAQNNYDMGKTPKDEQVALYGMKNHMQYQFHHNSAKQATNNFYGLGRDTFTDLNSGIDATMAGYSVTDTTNNGFPQITASVIAGENGQDSDAATAGAFGEFMEHAEKYAYIGRGYDKLTVTPLPDAMTDQKVTIEYRGPSAGCEVTEVDRGTHESAECSGRGNCDHSTGTCVCDAGYTLEACSEQTVLV